MELAWLSVAILEIPDFIQSGGVRRSERRLALEWLVEGSKNHRGKGEARVGAPKGGVDKRVRDGGDGGRN